MLSKRANPAISETYHAPDHGKSSYSTESPAITGPTKLGPPGPGYSEGYRRRLKQRLTERAARRRQKPGTLI